MIVKFERKPKPPVIKNRRGRLSPGEVIRCHNLDEMLNMDHFLECEGYSTDYVFRFNGETVYWIAIEGELE